MPQSRTKRVDYTTNDASVWRPICACVRDVFTRFTERVFLRCKGGKKKSFAKIDHSCKEDADPTVADTLCCCLLQPLVREYYIS